MKLSGKRNDIEISAEILRVAMSGAKKSHIVYKVNLNFKIVKKYLDNLERAGLITSSPGRNKIFSTTERGIKYLDHFETFEDFLKNPKPGMKTDKQSPGSTFHDFSGRVVAD